MKGEELLDLDICMLDTRYNDRWGTPKIREMGIAYKDEDGFGVVRIPRGWRELKKAHEKHFDHFTLPVLYNHGSSMDELLLCEVEERTMSPSQFYKIAPTFIREFAFRRLEGHIQDAEEYVEAKQNMPREEPHWRYNQGYILQSQFVKDIGFVLKSCPQIFGLPPKPTNIYHEVRLDNRFSLCALTLEELEIIKRNQRIAFTPFTICDFVIQYSPDDFVIIEVKLGDPYKFYNNGCSPLVKAKQQLSKACSFFEHNFGITPKLLRVHGREIYKGWKVGYQHMDPNDINAKHIRDLEVVEMPKLKRVG